MPLHKNILQIGQHFCYSALTKLLQGGRNTWHEFLGYVEMFYRGKWK